jgi:hypothetical protein
MLLLFRNLLNGNILKYSLYVFAVVISGFITYRIYSYSTELTETKNKLVNANQENLRLIDLNQANAKQIQNLIDQSTKNEEVLQNFRNAQNVSKKQIDTKIKVIIDSGKGKDEKISPVIQNALDVIRDLRNKK